MPNVVLLVQRALDCTNLSAAVYASGWYLTWVPSSAWLDSKMGTWAKARHGAGS